MKKLKSTFIILFVSTLIVGCILGGVIGNLYEGGAFITWKKISQPPDGKYPLHLKSSIEYSWETTPNIEMNDGTRYYLLDAIAGAWKEIGSSEDKDTYGFATIINCGEDGMPNNYYIRNPPRTVVENLDCTTVNVDFGNRYRAVILSGGEVWYWEKGWGSGFPMLIDFCCAYGFFMIMGMVLMGLIGFLIFGFVGLIRRNRKKTLPLDGHSPG
jgi:hypothetical protein